MAEAANAFGSQGFAEQFLGVVSSAMPLSGCCLYRVNDGRHIIGHQLFNLLPYWEQRYCHYFWRIDPLHPGRVKDKPARTQVLTRETAGQDAGAIEYFEQFLRPQNTAYQAELYFWVGSRIVAGASLLRDNAQGAFSEQNIEFLDKLVAFTESRLIPDADISSAWQGLAELTPREREIAFLVGEAICNKEIGRRLNIELPTVKAHVSRVLAKAGARSRAELIKRLQSR